MGADLPTTYNIETLEKVVDIGDAAFALRYTQAALRQKDMDELEVAHWLMWNGAMLAQNNFHRKAIVDCKRAITIFEKQEYLENPLSTVYHEQTSEWLAEFEATVSSDNVAILVIATTVLAATALFVIKETFFTKRQ